MQTDITNLPLARQLAREALEAAETAAQRWIDFLDLVRGDPDEEDCDVFGKHPDDEDDDPAEESDEAEDDTSDCCCAGDARVGSGGDDGRPGDPEDAEDGNDAEREQMIHDVPCIPVVALEPNLFTGEREYLGLSNLQPTFVGNGHQVKAAD